MTEIETVKPMFIHKDYVKVDTFLRRLNADGKRFYYTTDSNNNIYLYPSVTSVLGAVIPKENYLISWIAERGEQQARIERDSKAAYGTAMHALIAKFLMNQKISLSHNFIKNFVLDLDLKYYEKEWIYELQKDLVAFAKFANDYEIKPIAIEIPLVSHIWKIAGAIDLVCEIKIKDEVSIAIIDFKSSRKGYNPTTNMYQLELYKQLWNENYTDIKVAKLFNWSPKDFRTNKPTYTITDQTDKAKINVLNAYIDIYYSTNKEFPSDRMVIDGDLKLGEDINNIKLIPIFDYVKSYLLKEL